MGDPWSAVSGRTIVDGPDENLDKPAHVLTGVISAALNRIIIMTPYFLPSRMANYCMETVARSRELTIEEVDNRPFPGRLRDGFFWLFSPYL
ncbi:MAG: hypothetical protein RRA15_07605 [bacterium]|nr:hypothetical protein [bacterium]MDT8366342.1 hypothetical protein [bacterium]